MADAFSTVEAELPRDRWGRPLITPPEGGDPVAYQRVTTFVGALEDTYHLGLWQQRMVALGMSQRRDLVLAASAITDPSQQYAKRTLNGIAKDAIGAAKGTAAATTGTALHSFSEFIDRGEPLPVNVPEEYVPDLEAYATLVRPMFTALAIEGFCVVDHLRVGGSYDRILSFNAEGLDAYEGKHGSRLTYPDGREVEPGDAVIGDLKTGGIDFGIGKIAMQLGVYANAQDYDHTLGSRSPLTGNPSREWAVVIHLPAGTGQARLVWVDIAAGWETASTVAPLVHAWRKRKANDLSSTFASASAAPVAAPNLAERIRTASSREALVMLYAENKAAWTPGLTALAKERQEALGASS